MKARFLLVLAVVGCGGSGGDPGTPDAPPTPDTEPPYIVSSTPGDGEMKASILTSFTFVFNEALDPSTVSVGTVNVMRRDDSSFPMIAGTVTYDETAHSVIFTPLAPLQYDSLYIVTLGGAIKDTSGNAFAGGTQSLHTYANFVTREVQYAANGQITTWTGYVLDANGHETDSLTYTAPGANTTWLDGDDVASQRYGFAYAADGRFLAYRQLDAGNDGIVNTSDDRITLQDSYTFDAMLRLIRFAEANGPGGDATWGTADDLQVEHAEYAWDGYAITSHEDFTNAGGDGIWNNADDTGTFWRQVTHDTSNNITRSTYTTNGLDGLPMTGDDSIQSSIVFEYDATYSSTRSISYNNPGSDGVWLDADDRVQYYSRNDLDADGQLLARVTYVGAGGDQMWFTSDDTAAGRQTRTYNATKLVVERASYSSAGGDNMWGTSDDVLGNYAASSYDANGNRTSEKIYTGAGGDGVWHTADDVLFLDRQFDTSH